MSLVQRQMKWVTILGLALSFCTEARALPENFHPITDILARGARPELNDLTQLKARGFQTIISIENDPDAVPLEAGFARNLNLVFVNIPMSSRVRPTDAAINRVLKTMVQKQLESTEAAKTFIHCHHGEDRTGLVVALFRVEVQHWTPKAAFDEMIKYGFKVYVAQPLAQYYQDRTGYHIPPTYWDVPEQFPIYH